MNRFKSPWTLTAVLFAILLLLFTLGRWRAGGTGAQVQVPMFYDAHYLFPRAWTQKQEAPGVPAPAPLGFYGDNRISQTFIAGANRLSMIEIWLQGPPYAVVNITMEDDAGNAYAGNAFLPEQPQGAYYRFTFPPLTGTRGRPFRLTLSAPGAAAEEPAITRVIGGDQLGGVMGLNEYDRPGNLELQTYVQGGLFHWPLGAIGQQLLPDPFRLRLQQYKPEPLKGAIFSVLAVVTAVLSILFLILAAPSSTRAVGRTVGWGLALLLFAFLAWQLLDGRVKLTSFTASELTAVPPPADVFISEQPRIVHDLTAVLWTTERLPEKRFFDTEITREGFPAIHTPADATIKYGMIMPPNGRLHVGGETADPGQTQFTILWNDEVLGQQLLDNRPGWFDIDLTPWAGQDGVLALQTKAESGRPDARWLMPQITAQTDWLLAALPAGAEQAGHRFGESVELVGYKTEADGVTLYWRTEQPLRDDGVVFVHLLDENGELAGQHDGRPVGGSYPTAVWPSGVIIADFHPLPIPPGTYQLAIGLYNPITGERWAVVNPDGQPVPNNSAVLELWQE